MVSPDGLRVIRSWYRLQLALGAFGRDVRREYGLTGEQLAMLRIVGEQESWRMEELRGRLVMHPATLGQAVDRLAGRGLVLVAPDPSDGRRRNVAATDAGRELLAEIPLAGPVRLRAVDADPDRLARLADAFDDAIELFGLEKWA